MELQIETKQNKISHLNDRPAWIPNHITDNWDTCPLAYQTEEEYMAQGGLHGKVLIHIASILSYFLKQRNFMFLVDVFMLYRNKHGKRKRIAPDVLLMEYRDMPPTAYDLDIEPLPKFVAEVTSPSSREMDLDDKPKFYLEQLGISCCLVIETIDENETPLTQFKLHLWRLVRGRMQKIKADAKGGFDISEIGVHVYAIGQQLVFTDLRTGELLSDVEGLMLALKEEKQSRLKLEKAFKQAQSMMENLTQFFRLNGK